jgi:hypothetical protein
VPVVSLDVRPYEQLTVRIVKVAGHQTVTAALNSEQAEVLVESCNFPED